MTMNAKQRESYESLTALSMIFGLDVDGNDGSACESDYMGPEGDVCGLEQNHVGDHKGITTSGEVVATWLQGEGIHPTSEELDAE